MRASALKATGLFSRLDSERSEFLDLAVISRAWSEEHMQSETMVLGRIKHNDHLLSTLKVALGSLSPILDHVLHVPLLRSLGS